VHKRRAQGKNHQIHQRVEIATFNKELPCKKKNGKSEAKGQHADASMLMVGCQEGRDADDSATRRGCVTRIPGQGVSKVDAA